MTTPDPAHLRSRHDRAVRGGHHAGKPILHICAQRIVGSEFRDLRSFGTAISVPLGGRGPVLGVAATRGGYAEYPATTAQWHADRRAKRPKVAKLAAHDALRTYVQDRLAGVISASDGTVMPGPEVRWIGRRHGRRQDRRWATSWSPEQIANRLRVDYPDDASMRISHEAIYQALYVQGRGALRRELVACLRTGRALRVPRARSRGRGKTFVAPEVLISQRPAGAQARHQLT